MLINVNIDWFCKMQHYTILWYWHYPTLFIIKNNHPFKLINKLRLKASLSENRIKSYVKNARWMELNFLHNKLQIANLQSTKRDQNKN